MKVSAQVLSSMLDVVREGVYHTDLHRRIVHWNASAQRITGHSAESVTNILCQQRVVRHVDAQGHVLCSTARCPLLVPLQTGKSHQADLFLHHQEGHLVPVSVRTHPYRDEEGTLVGLTLLFQERTPVKLQGATEWRRAARTDVLTGVGNRRGFQQAWNRSHRALTAKGIVFGLLMVDVDHFKRVNDTYGHQVGDRVLKMVARTLVASVRDRDAVVRWGGEEFLLLIPQTEEKTLADLAERVRKLLTRGWVLLADGSHLSVTASIGGALVRPSDRPEDLIARADARLLACKAAGRNRSIVGE